MPPNQFAQVMSCTPGVLRMISPWLVGIEKIIEVDLMVTSRCAELAADTAWNPSSTARSAENRNTASATLRIVSAVRGLLRRALLTTRPRNFIRTLHERPPEPAALHTPRPYPTRPTGSTILRTHAGLLNQRSLLQVQQVRRARRGL